MHARVADSEMKQPAAEAEAAEARLVRELTAQAPPAARTPDEWEKLYGELLRTLLSATTYPDPASPDRPRPPKMILEEIIVAAGSPGREAQRAALVRAMLALLQSSDRLNDRIFLLRQLALVGREEVVPPLARLLKEKGDRTLLPERPEGGSAQKGPVPFSPDSGKAAEVPALWQYALGALESNTSAAAAQALVAALEQAAEPARRVAVIQALGRRREKSAAGPLARDLDNRDAQVAAAAAMALGSIATPEAAQALASAAKTAPEARRAVLSDARLLCADRMVARGEKDAAYAIFKELHGASQDPLLKVSAQRGMDLSKPR